MKSFSKTVIAPFLLALLFAVQSFAGEITKTFKGVDEVRIKTVSGNCIVQKWKGNEVKVVVEFTFNEYDFEPEFEQRGSRLVLTERFARRRNLRGHSTWRLTVPEKTDIDFSTASGDLEASNLKSRIEASTASGNIDLKKMAGEFEVSTASGDVDARDLEGTIKFSTASGNLDLSGISGESKISTASGNIRASKMSGEIRCSAASGNVKVFDAKGEFNLNVASGDVEAKGLTLTGESSFSVASGDVEVGLAKSPEHDLKVSSASGDARLNFNNNPIRGFIEMTARTRKGRIKAPFEFDSEDIYYKWDNEFVTKTVRKGADSPHIEISTASGKAVLLQK